VVSTQSTTRYPARFFFFFFFFKATYIAEFLPKERQLNITERRKEEGNLSRCTSKQKRGVGGQETRATSTTASDNRQKTNISARHDRRVELGQANPPKAGTSRSGFPPSRSQTVPGDTAPAFSTLLSGKKSEGCKPKVMDGRTQREERSKMRPLLGTWAVKPP
jgi:hypothetical protein